MANNLYLFDGNLPKSFNLAQKQQTIANASKSSQHREIAQLAPQVRNKDKNSQTSGKAIVYQQINKKRAHLSHKHSFIATSQKQPNRLQQSN